MKNWQIRIGTLLAVVVLLTMLLSTGAVIWLNYQRDIDAGEAATSSLFMRLVHSSNEQVADLEHRGEHLTSALVLNSAVAMSSLDEGLEHQVAIMTQLMKPGDSIYSLFKGLDDGTYLEVSNLEASPRMRAAWQASPEDRWVVMVVRDGQETRQYLDAQLRVNSSSVTPSGFEAKRRPWFVLANEEGVSQTVPYALTLTANNAISFVQKTPRQHMVGAIVLLNSLNDLLKNSGLQAGYEAIIFNSKGHAIAKHPFDGAAAPKPSVPGLQTELIGVVDGVLAVSSAHPLAATESRLTWEQLRNERWVLIRDTTREQVPRETLGITPNRRLVVNSMHDKIAAQMSGLGIGFLPRARVQAYLESGQLVALELSEPREAHQLLLACRSDSKGLGLHTFVRCLLEKGI